MVSVIVKITMKFATMMVVTAVKTVTTAQIVNVMLMRLTITYLITFWKHQHNLLTRSVYFYIIAFQLIKSSLVSI